MKYIARYGASFATIFCLFGFVATFIAVSINSFTQQLANPELVMIAMILSLIGIPICAHISYDMQKRME